MPERRRNERGGKNARWHRNKTRTKKEVESRQTIAIYPHKKNNASEEAGRRFRFPFERHLLETGRQPLDWDYLSRLELSGRAVIAPRVCSAGFFRRSSRARVATSASIAASSGHFLSSDTQNIRGAEFKRKAKGLESKTTTTGA